MFAGLGVVGLTFALLLKRADRREGGILERAGDEAGMIDTVISDLGQVLLKFDNRLFFERMTAYTDRSIEEIRAVDP